MSEWGTDLTLAATGRASEAFRNYSVALSVEPAAHRWATSLLGISDDRVHRWRTRHRQPGGVAMHTLLAGEVKEILEIAEQWGSVDRSHRRLAHRGSYEHRVWVSPSTFRRV